MDPSHLQELLKCGDVDETRAYIRPQTTRERIAPRAQMESALLLLVRSAACYGPAPFRF